MIKQEKDEWSSEKTGHTRHGLTLIEIMVVIALLGIIASIAIPNIFSSKKAANESNAIGALRTINSAEQLYVTKHGVYGTLSQLGDEGSIDPAVAVADVSPKQGFLYILTVSASGAAYSCEAYPADWGATGERAFYVDQTGVVYRKLTPNGMYETLR